MIIDDARSLPAAAQEEKRKQAVRLRKQGYSYHEIADKVGVHNLTVGKWIRAYEAQGFSGIKSKPRGREPGSGQRLTLTQENRIRLLITDNSPDQLKLEYALWTRKAVQQLIAQETGEQLAIRTVGNYLAAWGFTPQKPAKKAYEQNPSLVEKWLKEDYPVISGRTKAEGAEIYWGDETGLRSDAQHGRGYAPQGKTPVIRLNARRESVNMISAISNQGKVRFQIYDGTMDADRLTGFMKRLIKDARRKVFLILDNLRVHHAKVVKAWLEENRDHIEVFYLPAYSPELNPDEYLNCDLKAGVHGGKPARKKGDLKKKVQSHMCMLQKKPERVKKYFNHPSIKYAA
ncbi:Transposase and inactivated derivatives [Hahella chejuensis KCTC 2396]|uniref:Transposase and inactivated derivatives n=1 Tax=Hahella chejuensis (strain KCTC 2396) TaxID=349521 RepID=Q2SH56_HAHCH|nr:IS630 family transposase [Hahella chejuensis]ABC30018.1 Transposase and inactivated derivatives [Hahella chejuensis KCTC 2396]